MPIWILLAVPAVSLICLAFWMGATVASRGHLVRSVRGADRWRVEQITLMAATMLAAGRPSARNSILSTFRTARVRIRHHAFTAAHPGRPAPPDVEGHGAVIFRDGRVVVRGGDGWHQRLAAAMMQLAAGQDATLLDAAARPIDLEAAFPEDDEHVG